MIPCTYQNNLQNHLLLRSYEAFDKEHLNSCRIIFYLFVPELSANACKPLTRLQVLLFLISIVL